MTWIIDAIISPFCLNIFWRNHQTHKWMKVTAECAINLIGFCKLTFWPFNFVHFVVLRSFSFSSGTMVAADKDDYVQVLWYLQRSNMQTFDIGWELWNEPPPELEQRQMRSNKNCTQMASQQKMRLVKDSVNKGIDRLLFAGCWVDPAPYHHKS